MTNSVLPRREVGRAAVVASIHAYADWLAAHPDVPTPGLIIAAGAHQPDVPEAQRVEHVARVALSHGAQLVEQSDQVRAEIDMHSVGVQIVHSVFTTIRKPEPPPNRYVGVTFQAPGDPDRVTPANNQIELDARDDDPNARRI